MYTISEVSKRTHLSSRTLRVWEEEGLLAAVAREGEGGKRIFDDYIFSRIEKIVTLKEFGLSLKNIRDVLDGQKSAVAGEILRQKSHELDEMLLRLLAARQRIARVQSLLDLRNEDSGLADLVATPEELALTLQKQLLSRSSLALTDRHKEYLSLEAESTDTESFLNWIFCLKSLKFHAAECGVPTQFVRGPSAGSLALRLCDWTSIDPVKENLVPRAPDLSWRDFHFDVPYSCDKGFLEKVMQVNAGPHPFRFTAFRLPVLDLVARFSGKSLLSEVPIVSENLLLGALREGDCAGVFGLDEAGSTLICRVFPWLPEEDLAPSRVGEDLRRYAPQQRDDVLRFMALRRPKTFALFRAFLDDTWREPEPCALSKSMPAENRGAAIFHEDLTYAIRDVTRWSLTRCEIFRRQFAKKTAPQSEVDEFLQMSDAASLNYLQEWVECTFSKAHLVAWWQRVALTLSCKIHDERGWKATLESWEGANGLTWNDYGVVSGEVKILTHM